MQFLLPLVPIFHEASHMLLPISCSISFHLWLPSPFPFLYHNRERCHNSKFLCLFGCALSAYTNSDMGTTDDPDVWVPFAATYNACLSLSLPHLHRVSKSSPKDCKRLETGPDQDRKRPRLQSWSWDNFWVTSLSLFIFEASKDRSRPMKTGCINTLKYTT